MRWLERDWLRLSLKVLFTLYKNCLRRYFILSFARFLLVPKSGTSNALPCLAVLSTLNYLLTCLLVSDSLKSHLNSIAFN